LLIDSGANVNIQEKNGCTAFDVASIIGEPDLPITLSCFRRQLYLERRQLILPSFSYLENRTNKITFFINWVDNVNWQW